MFYPHKKTANTKTIYHFDGNANDASGNNYNGTVTGATLANGRLGQSYDFDGSVNQYIDFGTLFALSKPVTVAFWIQWDSLTTGESTDFQLNIMSKRGGDAVGTWLITYRNASSTPASLLQIYTYNVTDGWKGKRSNTWIPSLGIWYHIVIVADFANTSASEIYVDGKPLGLSLDQTAPNYDTTVGTSYTRIGYHDGAPYSMDGRMDEFIVETAAWSAAEVRARYNKGHII